MRPRTYQLLGGLMALALFMACKSSSQGGSPAASNARITLVAQFEKRPQTPTGLGAVTIRPARYCWAEVREAGSNSLMASGYLGSDGTGSVTVPRGMTVYTQVYTQYQVPSADPNSFFMRGSVKNGPLPAGLISISDFNAISNWNVTSSNIKADSDGTLTVTALEDALRLAGAFNIADQAVTFAAAIRDMDGSTTLRLPNLHTFWTTSTSPVDQARTYPELTAGPGNTYLVTDSNRAIFSHGVFGNRSGVANTESDEWDDGVLQETFAHLLFADYSYKADGSSLLSLLRRDNDNVSVDRDFQSESTVAFVAGFADFLAGAVRNDSRLLDSWVDAGGVSRVAVFDLTDHGFVLSANKGEFTRGSIAVSLWGLWKNTLGGTPAGLGTLWAAVRSPSALANGTGEYEQATLGCYPSYLLGVQSRVTGATWSTALSELALEAIPNPTAAYFAGTALWETRTLPLNATGTLLTYLPSTNLYYDRNQSQAWRFIHGGTGTRTITMTPTGGQDFYLELFGPGGWVDGSFSSSLTGMPRTLTRSNLPAGTYAARVRAGATTLTGTFGYTLSVN